MVNSKRPLPYLALFQFSEPRFGSQIVDQSLIRCLAAGEEKGGLVSSEDEGALATVVLVPGKPADFTIAELAELAAAIPTETASEVSVGIAEQRASAPLADEVLHVVLSLGEDYAFAKILDATLGWARGKWRRRRRESEGVGESPQPIIVHFEGQVSLVFKLDLPDGEPLTYDGLASPRGQRRSQPRWLAGPAAPTAPVRPDAAWIYPLAISAEATASLREELERSSFEAEVADPSDPGPTITREDDGRRLDRRATAACSRHRARRRRRDIRPRLDRIAYLSTSTAIAELLASTGTRVEVLLKLRVPIALLDVSRDWRPGENRVDFHFLCGEFAEHPVVVLESRAI